MQMHVHVGEGTSRHTVLDDLRRGIVEGRFPPGTRFPARAVLEARYDASSVTIQRAMDHLRQEGFIVAQPRLATHVAEFPPHLFHYAMVFVSKPTMPPSAWSRFFTALAHEAIGLSGVDGRRIDQHYGIEMHSGNPDYRHLVAMVCAHRYAGMIFLQPPLLGGLHLSPLARDPGLPRVRIGTPTDCGFPTVTVDGETFVRKALDALAARGRRRIAILVNATALQAEALQAMAAQLPARGMNTRPYWLQRLSLHDPDCAGNWVHLLLSGPAAERPDGLVLWDDNLVDSALAGIVAAGVRVPDELDVIAHCNFPALGPAVLPVRRLGYDTREVLLACLASIDAQRRGETVPPVVAVPALFEEEVAAAREAQGRRATAA